MDQHRTPIWTRRSALAGLAAGAGAGLVGLGQSTRADEPPPETTKVRLLLDPDVPIVCYAPMYLAGDFLRLEGFTEIEYGKYKGGLSEAGLAAEGHVDFASAFVSDGIVAMEEGGPVSFLGGIHIGCVEFFAAESIAGLTDLPGHRLMASFEHGPEHVMLSMILKYVGLDPRHDVEWVFEPDYRKWNAAFIEGRVDLLMTSPTMSYELRDAGAGHVILSTTLDDPWRHHLCCMLFGRTGYIDEYPVATKRVVRAVMKASDLCAAEPDRAVRLLVERGATGSDAYARTLLGEIPYGSWRDYDLRSTIMFYALRLREAGLIERTPRQVLEAGARFEFVDQLAQEIKA